MFTYCHYQSYNHVQSCLKKDLFLTERVTSDCKEHVAPMDAAAVWDVHGVCSGVGGALGKSITPLDAHSVVSFGAGTRAGWKLDKYVHTVTI